MSRGVYKYSTAPTVYRVHKQVRRSTLHRICSRDNTQSNCAEHFKPHKNLASTLTNHTSCTRFSPVASQYRCTITNKHCAALKLSAARSGAQLTMHTARINVSDTQTRLQYRGTVQEAADARRAARSARVPTTSIHQPHAASLWPRRVRGVAKNTCDVTESIRHAPNDRHRASDCVQVWRPNSRRSIQNQ